MHRVKTASSSLWTASSFEEMPVLQLNWQPDVYNWYNIFVITELLTNQIKVPLGTVSESQVSVSVPYSLKCQQYQHLLTTLPYRKEEDSDSIMGWYSEHFCSYFWSAYIFKCSTVVLVLHMHTSVTFTVWQWQSKYSFFILSKKKIWIIFRTLVWAWSVIYTQEDPATKKKTRNIDTSI